MIRYIAIALICLAASSSVFAELPADPTFEELKAIVAKPHAPKLVLEELKVYPAIRQYKIEFTRTVIGEDDVTFNIEAAEKWVDGRYIVSTFQPPGLDEFLYMIVTYDEKHQCYRKWVIDSKAITLVAVGTRVKDSRTLSWMGDEPQSGIKSVGQELHSDDSTEWSEVMMIENRVVGHIKGKATELK